MFYQLPPAPPPAVVVLAPGTGSVLAAPEQAPLDATLSADCQRGSRNCFPKDRVGAGEEVVVMAVVMPRLDSALSL